MSDMCVVVGVGWLSSCHSQPLQKIRNGSQGWSRPLTQPNGLAGRQYRSAATRSIAFGSCEPNSYAPLDEAELAWSNGRRYPRSRGPDAPDAHRCAEVSLAQNMGKILGRPFYLLLICLFEGIHSSFWPRKGSLRLNKGVKADLLLYYVIVKVFTHRDQIERKMRKCFSIFPDSTDSPLGIAKDRGGPLFPPE